MEQALMGFNRRASSGLFSEVAQSPISDLLFMVSMSTLNCPAGTNEPSTKAPNDNDWVRLRRGAGKGREALKCPAESGKTSQHEPTIPTLMMMGFDEF
jgi:hypothetical protein